MAQTATARSGKPALELIEEAVHLLRQAPPGTLASYYLASLPFVLGLLFFWADMSQGAFAHEHIVPGSLALAGLFVWMKCWQTVFARQLLAFRCGEPPPAWPARRVGRLIVLQMVWQPWLLVLLPLSAVAVVPLPWFYAFCQNYTVLAEGDEATSARRAFRAGWQQAALWPGQNSVFQMAMVLFVLAAFINLSQAVLLPSELAKTFLGIDSIFTRGGWNPMNTTFLAILAGLTHLCVDPVIKAFYVLRIFYGRSLQTGQDLRAELRQFVAHRSAGATLAFAAALTLLLAWPATSASASPADAVKPESPAETKSKVSPEELDRSIRRVIDRPEYSWRLPRQKADRPPSFLTRVKEYIGKELGAFRDWLRKALKGKEKEERVRRHEPEESSFQWAGFVRVIMYVLVVAVAGVLFGLLAMFWLKHKKAAPKREAEPAAATPDIRDEGVTADQLPEDGWLDLARRLIAKGDRRLALRALYLACLALLGQRELIQMAKCKSNREYLAELQRRTHALPDLAGAFSQNVLFFEDAWYGLHDVNETILDRFVANQRRIRDIVQA